MANDVLPIKVLSVHVPLEASQLPREESASNQPAGEVILRIELEGSALVLSARLNGKKYRRALKAFDVAPASSRLVLQGWLHQAEDGSLEVRDAGLQVSAESDSFPADQGSELAVGADR